MTRRLTVLAILTSTLFSCSQRGIIEGDKFPSVIADLYLVDKAVTLDLDRIQRVDTLLLYEPVFRKYGYTTDDFIRTIDHYISRPAKLKSFFNKAKDILENRKANAERMIAKEEMRKELLRKISLAVSERDSLKVYDRFTRAVRWIFAPDSLPSYRLFLPDSLAEGYEFPASAKWWGNNLKSEKTLFYEYEKDRRTLSLSPRKRADQDGLSLPEH